MKYCENGHGNKDDAQFCAICGKSIVKNSDEFTLDKFSNISFEITDYHKYKPYTTGAVVGLSILLILPGFLAAMINRQFKNKATFIEKTKNPVKRIAHNGHLGLFKERSSYERSRLLLLPIYDDIEIANTGHYILHIKNRYGVYSVQRKKIIVPVKFERVFQEHEGVWSAIKKGKLKHFNYNGDRVK